MKSKLSRLLTAGKRAWRMRRHPPLAVEQLELREAQQIGRMVDALCRTLSSQFVVLAQEGRQLECLEVMYQQDLGHVAHAALPSRAR